MERCPNWPAYGPGFTMLMDVHKPTDCITEVARLSRESLVILTGPECCGTTTIAEKVSQELNLPFLSLRQFFACQPGDPKKGQTDTRVLIEVIDRYPQIADSMPAFVEGCPLDFSLFAKTLLTEFPLAVIVIVPDTAWMYKVVDARLSSLDQYEPQSKAALLKRLSRLPSYDLRRWINSRIQKIYASLLCAADPRFYDIAQEFGFAHVSSNLKMNSSVFEYLESRLITVVNVVVEGGEHA